MSAFHLLLPANYAERSLTENAEEIRRAGNELEKWIPDGCTYGLYSSEGAWKQGPFSGREQQNAWTHYKNNHFFGENGCYYHFIPATELLVPILYLVLLMLNVSFLSGSFAKRLKEQLQELRVIMDKISENDLEFETQPSNIREINEEMYSLGSMKDALQDSLQRQWDLEKQKHEQLSALAHDIKTPLTVIRGNVSFAVEHTDQQQGIEISIRLKQKEDHFYLAASVRDYGTGFSGQELSHAAEVSLWVSLIQKTL